MGNENFSTRDLGLAATLLTLKHFHTRIDFSQEGTSNNPVGYFIFEDSPELQEASQAFRRGEILVEPKAFLGNLHALKAEVMNFIKSPHSK